MFACRKTYFAFRFFLFYASTQSAVPAVTRYQSDTSPPLSLNLESVCLTAYNNFS